MEVHFKMSRVGGDTNPGDPPWAVSPPPTFNAAMGHFEMHSVVDKTGIFVFCSFTVNDQVLLHLFILKRPHANA